MATYTAVDVKQFLEGSIRINEERRMITQFCRMVAAAINRALKLGLEKTYRNTIDYEFPNPGANSRDWSVFHIEWEAKICASGYNVKMWWDGIDITAHGTDRLHAYEIIMLYDRLPEILMTVVEFFLA